MTMGMTDSRTRLLHVKIAGLTDTPWLFFCHEKGGRGRTVVK